MTTQYATETITMTTNPIMSFRITPANMQRLDIVAEATKRSKSFIANEAVNRYLETEADIIEKLYKGMEQSKAGKVVSHEEAMIRFNNTITRAAAEK